MDTIKILQWNCRGLENKIHELFLFLTKDNIDIVCLNEVKKWQKRVANEKYFIVTEEEQKRAVIMGLLSLHRRAKRSKRSDQLHPGKTLTDRH